MESHQIVFLTLYLLIFLLFQFIEEMKQQNENKFAELSQKDSQVLVEPDKEFECPVCCSDIDVGDGIRLRGCLHEMCK